MKPIALTNAEWLAVYNRLAKRYEHRPSVLLLRSKMKEELGFTVRHHREWTISGTSQYTIFLDFYSEEAATMFRMTYL